MNRLSVLSRLPLAFFVFTLGAMVCSAANAATYRIDPAHSFVSFRISHLGYSLLIGRFNDISGTLEYDPEKEGDSAIQVEIKTASVDTNHGERDKHLRGEDFLDVDRYPLATFTSTGFEINDGRGTLKGMLNLHGVEKEISFPVTKIGMGPDPWGGQRAGFEGRYTLKRADFGMDYNLGPAAEEMELELFIEGIME